jgi:hypothetical protein
MTIDIGVRIGYFIDTRRREEILTSHPTPPKSLLTFSV